MKRVTKNLVCLLALVAGPAVGWAGSETFEYSKKCTFPKTNAFGPMEIIVYQNGSERALNIVTVDQRTNTPIVQFIDDLSISSTDTTSPGEGGQKVYLNKFPYSGKVGIHSYISLRYYEHPQQFAFAKIKIDLGTTFREGVAVAGLSEEYDVLNCAK